MRSLDVGERRRPGWSVVVAAAVGSTVARHRIEPGLQPLVLATPHHQRHHFVIAARQQAAPPAVGGLGLQSPEQRHEADDIATTVE